MRRTRLQAQRIGHRQGLSANADAEKNLKVCRYLPHCCEKIPYNGRTLACTTMMGTRKLLYIAAPSYSGSTLLTILLDCHPEITTVGELKASAFGDIETYPCSCGQRLLDCPHWNRFESLVRERQESFRLSSWNTHFGSDANDISSKVVRAELRGAWFECVRDVALSIWPAAQRRLHRILDVNRACIDAQTQIADAPVFLDGSKDPIRAKYFARYASDYDLYLINLVRDGRGVTNSYMRHESVPIGTAIDQWQSKVIEMQRLARIVGDTHHREIRYEDLCREPLETLNAILEFTGLDPLQELPLPLRADERHILGNTMRLKDISAVLQDEKWRTSLTSTDLETFARRAGTLNASLGYDA